MDYTTFTLEQCFNLAVTEFGHEEPHTVAIAKLLDLVNRGVLDRESATNIARFVYHDGYEACLYYNEDWEEEEEEYPEPDWEAYEMGFDPYMGCYTGDC